MDVEEVKVINSEEGDVLVGLFYVIVFYLALVVLGLIVVGVVWLVKWFYGG